MFDWAIVSKIGIQLDWTSVQARNVMLANRIALVTFLLSAILFVSYALTYPWNLITTAMPIVSLAALATLTLNAFGFTRTSRLWLCSLLPISCLLVSILSKMTLEPIQDSEYYEFRLIMIVSGVIPCILFSLKEIKLLLASLGIHVMALLLYDPLHNLMGVGYYQMGQHDNTYYFTNLVVMVTFALLITAVLFLKNASESSEDKNNRLIGDLEDRNARIEAQNHQILKQSRVLTENQQRLSDAYRLIERQKELLYKENRNLEEEMIRMNKELTQTNVELVKYNTELRQFSFTVSHNLRSPVASLLGLVDLINLNKADGPNKEVLVYIKEAAHQLDGIISDLHKIIDIRHDIFKIRQRIAVQQEIDDVVRLFQDKLKKHNIQIKTDIHCPEIFSVKPMVHSILYNLISNSIKYRSVDQPLTIVVGVTENNNYYVFRVTDNGLGIDLNQHRDSLFQLYKRFHLHTDGKGLGLYLVKLQAESLGGFVDVESELNKFTKFSVYLRKPINLSRQILYDEQHAMIFYDAMINSMGVIWNGHVSSIQYRKVYVKCLEFLNVYNTPNWISDLTDQQAILKEDQEWMFREIVPAAANNGLKRVIAIKSNSAGAFADEYMNGIAKAVDQTGVNHRFFASFQEAASWIQQENEKGLKTSLQNNGEPS
jgi:signal transduction histidine kinase